MENKDKDKDTDAGKTMTKAELAAFEEKIRTDATELAKADMQKAIQDAEAKAGKTEKDKMYSTLEKKDEVNKLLKEKLAAYESEEAAKVQKEAEEALAKLDATERIKNLEIQNLKIAEDAKGLVTEVRESFSKELLKRDLEVYKQTVISANTGEIIPDMVTGNSKEEIDNAVTKSKIRYQELFKAQQQKEENEKLDKGYLPQTPDNNKIPDQTNPEKGGKSVWEMNAEEFAKYSDDQLKGWQNK